MTGQGNITFGNITPQSGAPFAAGSAFNGLSVDAATGKIVFGDDVGNSLADLISSRDLEMGNFRINLKSATNAGTILIAPPEMTFTNSTAGRQITISALSAPTITIASDQAANPPQILFSKGGGTVDNHIADQQLLSGDFKIGNISGAGNRTAIFINDTNTQITFNATLGILTTDPGSGAGAWLLGKVIVGAVVVDAANYVETMIDGVIVKLIKAV